MSMNPKLYTVVTRALNLRNYTYRAYINRKTRRLYKIKAGCRTWYSIRKALDHYAEGVHAGSWCSRHVTTFNPKPEQVEMWRLEAVMLLRKLERDVLRHTRRMRARKRRR